MQIIRNDGGFKITEVWHKWFLLVVLAAGVLIGLNRLTRAMTFQSDIGALVRQSEFIFRGTVKKFNKQRDQAAFTGWMERASQSRIPEMKSLSAGIERDRAAVVAELAYEWSNGTTEAHINRLKTLKGDMYGRAKFDLLRIKVLDGSKRGAG